MIEVVDDAEDCSAAKQSLCHMRADESGPARQ